MFGLEEVLIFFKSPRTRKEVVGVLASPSVAWSISMNGVRKIIPDAILLHETATPPMKCLLCRSTDIGEVTIDTGTLRKAPGIESATITLNRDLLFSTELEHSLVRKQVGRLTAAGVTPPKDGRKRVSTL